MSPAARTTLRTINRVPFWAQTLLGLAIGAGLGLVAREWSLGWLTETLTQIGSVFVTLLRTAVARENILDRGRFDAPRNDVLAADHTRLPVEERELQQA